MMLRSIRHLLLPLLLVVAFIQPSSGQLDHAGSQEFSIDKGHSSVAFSVRHLGIAKVRGSFNDFSGTVTFDESDMASLIVSVTIQVNSVDTGNERRDGDLRSDNFFNVETFPEMTFESIRIENVDGNTFDLVGNLTMIGTTKEVVLESEFFGVSGSKAGFSAEGSILRKEFGLSWDRLTEAGNVIVSNEVQLTLDVELKKVVE